METRWTIRRTAQLCERKLTAKKTTVWLGGKVTAQLDILALTFSAHR